MAQDVNMVGSAAPAAPATSSSAVSIYVFVFAMLLPFQFAIVGADFFPVRVVVLVLFLPLLGQLLSGAVGQIRGADIFILCYAFWTFISIVINEGLSRVPLGLVTFTDFFGGWLVGRVLIRSAEDFRCFMRAMIWSCVLMLPVVLVEFVTDFNILQKVFSPFFDTYSKGWSSYGRLGFERVMAGFAHPILYGVFCSIAVAGSYYALIHTKTRAKIIVLFLGFMTFTSLSSGPFLSAVIQIGLMIWGKVTRNAWKPLAWMTVVAYVVVDMLSNRTPITIAISYVTFNSDTAWYRVAQWRYGILEVWANPILGIGLGDWKRPHWLGVSIDNFWLLTAMKYGIPGFLLLAGGLLAVAIGLIRQKSLSEEQNNIRTGYMITFVGVIVVLTTVHVWGAMGVFMMMFFGAGMWIFDAQRSDSFTPRPQVGTSGEVSGDEVTGPPERVRPVATTARADPKPEPRARPDVQTGPSKPPRRALPMNGRIDRNRTDT